MKREEHHIIPVCLGGVNKPSNIVALSPMAHAIISIYQSEYYGVCCFHGRQKVFLPSELHELADKWIKVAANSATSARLELLSTDPAFNKRYSDSISKGLKKAWSDSEFYLKKVCEARAAQKKAVTAAMSQEARDKRLESFRFIGHQKGSKNSQFGTMWITDGETNSKIKRTDPIPDGFYPGRKLK
jgi:hypothetical protein